MDSVGIRQIRGHLEALETDLRRTSRQLDRSIRWGTTPSMRLTEELTTHAYTLQNVTIELARHGDEASEIMGTMGRDALRLASLHGSVEAARTAGSPIADASRGALSPIIDDVVAAIAKLAT